MAIIKNTGFFFILEAQKLFETKYIHLHIAFLSLVAVCYVSINQGCNWCLSIGARCGAGKVSGGKQDAGRRAFLLGGCAF